MIWPTPISFHFELYAYWLAKRGPRRMPARDDISPADIKPLLPHLIITERDGDQFRYKLFGRGVVEDLGYDATGYFVGEFLNNPNYYSEWRAVMEKLVALQAPHFVAGESCFESFCSGAHLDWSVLILPLSNDGITVNKEIASLVARFHRGAQVRGWSEHQPAKVLEIAAFKNENELKQLCADWQLEPA